MFSVCGRMEDLWVCLYINFLVKESFNIGCDCVVFGNCNWVKEFVSVFDKLLMNFGLIDLEIDFSNKDNILD